MVHMPSEARERLGVIETSCEAHIFEDVMIDIETMSLHPHAALVLSIGMIEFDPTSSVSGLIIGQRKLIVPSLYDQLLLGRHVDAGTQKWWAGQSAEAREHWFYAGAHWSIPRALQEVREFCAGKKRVWANGTQFDLSNIIGLAYDIGDDKEPMWHYQAPRDMRTFCRETAASRILPIGDALDIPGVAHEPIYDCIVQASQIWAHWQDK